MKENQCEFCEYREDDYVEEYELKIREIMIQAVNSKIKESLEDLSQLRVDFAKLKKDYDNAKHQINRINKEKEEEIKCTIQETEISVERRLGLDFTVGDTVFRAKSEGNSTKCPHCKDGVVIVNVLGIDKKVSCPFCDYGKITTYKWSPKSSTIRSIKFYMTSPDSWTKRQGVVKDENTEYNLNNSDSTFHRSNLFKTEEECRLVCDEMNKIEKERADKRLKGEINET